LCIQVGELDEAAVNLEALNKLMPNQGGILRGLAELALAREDTEKAQLLAEHSLSFDRLNPLAWQTLAASIKKLKGDKAALALLNEGEGEAKPAIEIRQTIFSVSRRINLISDVEKQVKTWVNSNPEEVKYRLMLADLAFQSCQFDIAERHLKDARELDEEATGSPLFHFYMSRERYGAAETLAKQLTRLYPQTMKHWGALAEVLYMQRKPEKAIEVLDKALIIEPNRLSLIRQKLGVLLALERFDDAVNFVAHFDAKQQTLESLQLHSDILRRAERFKEQLPLLEAAALVRPRHVTVQSGLAQALERLGFREEALLKWAELEELYPRNFDLVQKHVQALVRSDRLTDATNRVKRYCIEEQPPAILAAALAELLRKDGLLDESRSLLKESMSRNPEHFGLMLQMAMLEKRCEDESAERVCWLEIMRLHPVWHWFDLSLDAVIRLGLDKELERYLNDWRVREPQNTAPWWAAFRSGMALKRYQVAEQVLTKIATINHYPNVDIVTARIDLWSEFWRMDDCFRELTQALQLWPSNTNLIERLINQKAKVGIFDDFDHDFGRLKHLLGDRQYSHYQSFFFNINCLPDWSEKDVATFYRDWYRHAIKDKINPPVPYRNNKDPNRRLRIGYLSPDFRRHAVAYFSEPLMLAHEREQFEIFAYAHLDPRQSDHYTERFKSYFHHWIETRGMSDVELERRIRNDGIDILIDLAGHTSNSRLNVMTLRPAPVQASWIFGAGQTTGLPEVGHLITDESTIPEPSDKFYAEKVVRVAMTGFPFRPADDVLPAKKLPFLQNGYITFGVVARPVRINQRTISLWAEILQLVPNSVLRFDHVPYTEFDVQRRIRAGFATHGIDESRVDFKNSRPHWHAYQNIDIQLDTFPSGSGTTVSEGLYMERLPITLKARPPMGRIPTAQLTALGLTEMCVADTEQEYVQKAVQLASNFDNLNKFSTGLRARMVASPLMDFNAYSQKVAETYRSMWISWCDCQTSDKNSIQV